MDSITDHKQFSALMDLEKMDQKNPKQIIQSIS